MKQTGKSQPSRQEPQSADSSPVGQMFPLPRPGHEVLSAAIDLLRQFAAAHGKPVPLLSQDAAAFLIGRRWAIDELSQRVSRAVAANDGSLITAADLSDAA